MLTKGFRYLGEGFSIRAAISTMRLDGWKDFQYVKSAWSILHAELKAHILPLYRGTKDEKRTHTQMPISFPHILLHHCKKSKIIEQISYDM